MSQHTILDASTANHPAELFRKEERMIWEGRPVIQGYTEMPDLFTYIIKTPMLWGVLLGSLFISLLSWILGLQVLLIMLPVLLWNRIKTYRQINNTRYVVTNQRVFFQFQHQPAPNLHWLEYGEIQKIIWEEFEDKSGVIYFIPNPQVTVHFVTHNFLGKQEKRFYPSFESVPAARKLCERWKIVDGKWEIKDL